MKIKRGYLYLCDLQPRFGTEAGKARPVVGIQNDLLNDIDHPSTWILPCTTRLKNENLLRVQIPKNCAGNDKTCEIMIDQSRAVDNARFVKILGEIPDLIFREVIYKLKHVAGID